MIIIIAALSENNVIGHNGWMPWKLKSDLQRFKKLTRGHSIILGRRTYESIIEHTGKPLPERETFVLSRNTSYRVDNCRVFTSLESAVDHWHQTNRTPQAKLFVCGGGKVYETALPIADMIYLTRVRTTTAGDTFFPDFDVEDWSLKHIENKKAGDGDEFDSQYLVYSRRMLKKQVS